MQYMFCAFLITVGDIRDCFQDGRTMSYQTPREKDCRLKCCGFLATI